MPQSAVLAEVAAMRAMMRWTTTMVLLVVAVWPGLVLAAPAPPPAAPDGMQPPGREQGVFATLCRFSHQAPDDPIVFPGQAGKSHLHTFFGNTTTSAGS